MKINKSITLTVAVLGPIAVATLYMVIAHLPGFFMPGANNVAYGLALAIGAFSFFLSINGTWQRIIATFVYLPIAYFILTIYSLAFVCLLFRNCI